MSTARPSSGPAIARLVADRAVALALSHPVRGHPARGHPVPGHPVRVAVDGPSWSGLDLAPLVADALGAWSRPAVVVSVADFLRPASVRLERGRDDPDAFYDDWIDLAALDREVLGPCGPGGSRRVLPTLWDVAQDRATRADYIVVPDNGVVIVAGWLLLARSLPFDLTVHLAISPAALARRVPHDAAARELPAFARYDAQARPADVADIVVRADDPRRPAVIDRTLLRSPPCPPT